MANCFRFMRSFHMDRYVSKQTQNLFSGKGTGIGSRIILNGAGNNKNDFMVLNNNNDYSRIGCSLFRGSSYNIMRRDISTSNINNNDIAAKHEVQLPSYNDLKIDNNTISSMTNDELEDNTSIPGFSHLIHSPPVKEKYRGALVGEVVSVKMQKTVNVAVDRYRMVRKIRKKVKYTRKFMAHDETEVANKGDIVLITPCHRISKKKHFILRTIVKPKGQLA